LAGKHCRRRERVASVVGIVEDIMSARSPNQTAQDNWLEPLRFDNVYET
jgi:hypothetical protein